MGEGSVRVTPRSECIGGIVLQVRSRAAGPHTPVSIFLCETLCANTFPAPFSVCMDRGGSPIPNTGVHVRKREQGTAGFRCASAPPICCEPVSLLWACGRDYLLNKKWSPIPRERASQSWHTKLTAIHGIEVEASAVVQRGALAPRSPNAPLAHTEWLPLPRGPDR